MRNLVVLVVLLAVSAWAGEAFIGSIYVSDGGTVSNATTGYGSAGCSKQTDSAGAGACDQAFPIGQGIKLTIRCPDAALFSANRNTTDAGIGLPLAVDEKFPTSTSNAPCSISLPDGGNYVGGCVSIAPAPGAAAARCRVFVRAGTE